MVQAECEVEGEALLGKKYAEPRRNKTLTRRPLFEFTGGRKSALSGKARAKLEEWRKLKE